MYTLPLITLAAAFSMNAITPFTCNVPCVSALQDDGVQEMARGNVTKIDAANKTFTINSGAEGAKDVMVSWNDATVFMHDGKVVKWDEIVKEKANLTITHKKGLASKVECFKSP
jgi:hypothetical protein